jgi:branched-chain amino acid transport system ATP-binding protein
MLLSVENLTVHYGRLAAVRDISFQVAQGEIVCVVGPNGAGKSTTLLTISGALSPTAGSIHLDGHRIAGVKPEAIARRGFSLVPEGRHVFATLSVEENLRIGAGMRRDRHAITKDFDRVMTYFPRLAERLRSPAGRLSGGEQQMLVIGRAFLTKPRLIAIDEPSLGLAPQIVDQVYEILGELRRHEGLAILLVEQSAERALQAADRIYVLRSGRVELAGTSAELAGGDQLERAYFGFADGGN